MPQTNSLYVIHLIPIQRGKLKKKISLNLNLIMNMNQPKILGLEKNRCQNETSSDTSGKIYKDVISVVNGNFPLPVKTFDAFPQQKSCVESALELHI